MSDKGYLKQKRILSILEGIFLILFSAACAINMGYVMRTIMIALIALNGILVYGFLAFLVIQGFSLIIRGHALLPKGKLHWFLFSMLYLGVLILVSAIQYDMFHLSKDIVRDYFIMMNNSYPGGIYANMFLNIFSVPFGGGILGYLFATLFILMTGNSVILAIIIASILIAIPLLVLGIPKFIKFNKDRLAKKIEKEKNNEADPKNQFKKEPKMVTPKINNPKHVVMQESNVLLHADEIGEDEVVPLMRSNEITPVNFSERGFIQEGVINESPLPTGGGLEKARLDLFGSRDISTSTSNQSSLEEASPNYDLLEENNIEGLEEDLASLNPNFDSKEDIAISTATPSFEEKKEDLPIFKPEIKKPEPVHANPVVNKPKAVDISKPIEIKHTKVDWIPPATDALITYQTDDQIQLNIQAAKEKQEIVNKTFNDFKVLASVVDFVIGPSITRLLVDYPSTGQVRAVDKIKLDISRRLNGIPVRFAETVSGTPYSGLEVPNQVSATVSFKEVFEALPDSKKHPTAVAFGKDITGNVIYADMNEFPHLLVSGTSGSGKSVFVNSLIITLIARTSPDDLKIVLVDPKRVEMNRYRDEPHLFCPVINDAKEAKNMLNKMVDFMNERYRLFEEADNSTNLKEYNRWANEHKRPTLPYVVIFLDEYADLAYSCKDIATPLVVICQKARASGIHVVVSTQRPSTDVITGTIKANLHTRVSLTAASYTDSMTILDEGGAESLLGNGDMLVKSPLISRAGLSRLQGCYIQTSEMNYIINYLKRNYTVNYHPDFMDLSDKEPEPTTNLSSPLGDAGDSDEEKYNWIKEWALSQEYVSMSKIQRECSVGFNRAGKIVRRLQDEGILSTDTEGSNKGFKVIGGTSRFNDTPDLNSDELTRR